MTRARRVGLAVSAAAAEVAAASLLLRPASFASGAALVLLHGLGTLASVRWLDEVALNAGLERATLLGWAVALFVPVFGPLGLAALFGSVGRAAHAFELDVPATLTRMPELSAAPAATVAPVLGDGALGARLRHARDPDVRVQSVLATRRLDGARATRLLRVALCDHHEDVRLLAYALLEDRERQSDERIQQLQRELLGAHAAERRVALNELLAHAHWEVCYKGLVAGELETFEIERARAHLDAAGTEGSSAAGRFLLRARLLLRQGDAGGARAALDESRRRGMPARTIDPYLSECAFMGRYPRHPRPDEVAS
jgi:hypothetical protein